MGKSAAGVVISLAVISLQSAVISLAVVSLTFAQAPQVATPKWSVTEGMDSPESVYYDAASGFVFSSQIGGDASAKDGNGRIVKLTIDGKVVDTKWSKATLNAPKGLRAYRGTLFVADIDEVVGFEIASGREVSRVKTDAKFLNDLTTSPDGAIYASDSFQNRIYVIRDGVASVFVESPKLALPNGVLVDAGRLVVAIDGGQGVTATLYAVDLRTRELTQLTTQSIGTPDGLESDGAGGFIVSDVGRGGVYHVDAKGQSTQIRQLDRQPADISYIPGRKLLLVPHLGLNRVSAYDLSHE